MRQLHRYKFGMIPASSIIRTCVPCHTTRLEDTYDVCFVCESVGTRVQAPVAPQLAALTDADCVGLRRTATSGALEFVLVVMLFHQHCKLLECSGCMDTISPFVKRYGVRFITPRIWVAFLASCARQQLLLRNKRSCSCPYLHAPL